MTMAAKAQRTILFEAIEVKEVHHPYKGKHYVGLFNSSHLVQLMLKIVGTYGPITEKVVEEELKNPDAV